MGDVLDTDPDCKQYILKFINVSRLSSSLLDSAKVAGVVLQVLSISYAIARKEYHLRDWNR